NLSILHSFPTRRSSDLDYVNRFVDSLEVVPGSGRVKEFKGNAYDYSMASGYVGVKATEWLSFNFGHGKQFIGHGRRSLLLSDNRSEEHTSELQSRENLV